MIKSFLFGDSLEVKGRISGGYFGSWFGGDRWRLLLFPGWGLAKSLRWIQRETKSAWGEILGASCAGSNQGAGQAFTKSKFFWEVSLWTLEQQKHQRSGSSMGCWDYGRCQQLNWIILRGLGFNKMYRHYWRLGLLLVLFRLDEIISEIQLPHCEVPTGKTLLVLRLHDLHKYL